MIKIKKITKILFSIFVLILGIYLTKERTFPNQFEVINNTNKFQFDRKQDFSGATLVNLDQDPEQEVFISGYGSSNLLLKRVKDKFFSIDIPELSDSEGLTFSVTACDIDQDGRDEILILNRPEATKYTSHSRILKFVNGKWKDILSKDDPIIEAIKFGYSAACIDRKGDGRYGLAISNENGKLSYLEKRDSTIRDIAESIGIALKSKGRSILGIPSAGGNVNIFVGNENGPNFYFVNNGDGVFSEKAVEVGVADPDFNARGISLIDINHDDIPDIVYGNNFGPVRLLEQTREGKFNDVTSDEMKDSYAVNSVVVGDFNLDGFEDIYLNNIRGNNKVFARYENDWYELNLKVLAEKDMFGISTIAGDLDKNGSYDLLNTHGDGVHFPVTFFSIDPVNKWMKFSIKYDSGGIPRGAIIRLRTSKRDQIRVISSGSGRFANYDSELIFGFLPNESVTSLEVTLPSGAKTEFKEKFKMMGTHELVVRSPSL